MQDDRLIAFAFRQLKKHEANYLTQDRQKSYADTRRRVLKFEVRDMVSLEVALWKGVIQFQKRGKLNPWYIRPFQILE